MNVTIATESLAVQRGEEAETISAGPYRTNTENNYDSEGLADDNFHMYHSVVTGDR